MDNDLYRWRLRVDYRGNGEHVAEVYFKGTVDEAEAAMGKLRDTIRPVEPEVVVTRHAMQDADWLERVFARVREVSGDRAQD